MSYEDYVCPYCGVPKVESLTMCGCDGEDDCCSCCGNDLGLCECEYEEYDSEDDEEPCCRFCGELYSWCDCTL